MESGVRMNKKDKQKMLDILAGKVEKCAWCKSHGFKVVRETRSFKIHEDDKEDLVMRKCECDCGAEWWDFRTYDKVKGELPYRKR